MFDYDSIVKPNLDKINKKENYGFTAVICKTKDEAKALLDWAESKSLKWSDGKKYNDNIRWDKFREDTIYTLGIGLYGSMQLELQDHIYKDGYNQAIKDFKIKAKPKEKIVSNFIEYNQALKEK